MKILIASEFYHPIIKGGGEINIKLIAEALAKNNEVYLLTSCFDQKDETINNVKVIRKFETSQNVESLFGNMFRSLIFPFSLKKKLKETINELNPDIVHLTGNTILAAKDIKKYYSGKIFATIESYITLCPKGDLLYKGKTECKFYCNFSRFIQCFIKSDELGKMKNKFYLKYNPLFWIYLFSHHLRLRRSMNYVKPIAISTYVNNVIQRYSKKGKVLPNIINPFSKTKTRSKKLRILYLGSYNKFKGPQILIKALGGLQNYECNLYGEGPLKEELIQMSKEMNVNINGKVNYNQIKEIYNNHDIVVFPSIWPEPFGRISVEGMSSGTVVIASDIAGIKETSQTQLTFEPGNYKELHKKIIEASNNIPKYVTKGIEESKEYTEEKVIQKLIKIYNDAQ